MLIYDLLLVADGQKFPSLKNKGGPPDIKGVWLGPDPYASIMLSSGFLYTRMQKTDNGDMIPILGMTRFESWECTGVEGQSMAVYEHYEIGPDGTVLESNTACSVYLVSPENGTLATIVSDNSCPSPEDVTRFIGEFNRVEGSYLSYNLNSTLVVSPTDLLCTEGANITGMDTSEGAKYTGGIVGAGTNVGDLTPAIRENQTFPPNFSADTPHSIENGIYYGETQDNQALYFVLKIGDIYASPGYQNNTFLPIFGRYSGFKELNDQPFTYQTSWIRTQLSSNGSIENQEGVCGLISEPSEYELIISESTSTCPTTDNDGLSFERLYFIPEGGQITKGYAAALDINGSNQVPPLTNISTKAQFRMDFPNMDGFVNFEMVIDGISDYMMSHIHAGNSTTNGDVVVKLVPSGSNWPTSTTSSGGLTMLNPPISGTLRYTGAFSESDFVGPLQNTSMEDFIKSLSNDQNYYVNLHTTEYPAGAVRGQLSAVVKPAPAPESKAPQSPSESPSPSPSSPTPSPPSFGAKINVSPYVITIFAIRYMLAI
jgi:hypothetical protein